LHLLDELDELELILLAAGDVVNDDQLAKLL
jgi:hypothetical protein